MPSPGEPTPVMTEEELAQKTAAAIALWSFGVMGDPGSLVHRALLSDDASERAVAWFEARRKLKKAIGDYLMGRANFVMEDTIEETTKGGTKTLFLGVEGRRVDTTSA